MERRPGAALAEGSIPSSAVGPGAIQKAGCGSAWPQEAVGSDRAGGHSQPLPTGIWCHSLEGLPLRPQTQLTFLPSQHALLSPLQLHSRVSSSRKPSKALPAHPIAASLNQSVLVAGGSSELCSQAPCSFG